MSMQFTNNHPIFAAWGGQPPRAIQSGTSVFQAGISAGSIPPHSGLPVLQGGPRYAYTGGVQLPSTVVNHPFTSLPYPRMPLSTTLWGHDNNPVML